MLLDRASQICRGSQVVQAQAKWTVFSCSAIVYISDTSSDVGCVWVEEDGRQTYKAKVHIKCTLRACRCVSMYKDILLMYFNCEWWNTFMYNAMFTAVLQLILKTFRRHLVAKVMYWLLRSKNTLLWQPGNANTHLKTEFMTQNNHCQGEPTEQ